MDANWQYGEEGRWWQIVRCSCCRVRDPHSTDVSGWLVFWRWGLTFPGRQAYLRHLHMRFRENAGHRL
jgi:hypothetical protein